MGIVLEEARGAYAGAKRVICALIHIDELAVFWHFVAVLVAVELVADEGAVGRGVGRIGPLAGICRKKRYWKRAGKKKRRWWKTKKDWVVGRKMDRRSGKKSVVWPRPATYLIVMSSRSTPPSPWVTRCKLRNSRKRIQNTFGAVGIEGGTGSTTARIRRFKKPQGRSAILCASGNGIFFVLGIGLAWPHVPAKSKFPGGRKNLNLPHH